MGIEQHKVPDHLNYFLCIEEDIAALSRWIEISEPNFNCYSLELARLLMTASAKVDVLAKLICKDVDPNSKAGSITAYQEKLVEAYPKLPDSRVTIRRYGLELRPWSNWSTPKSPPLWWQANNKVKHHRSEHFNEATLKNVLNAVSGLLIFVLLYYGPRKGAFQPAPTLFEPWSFGYKDGNSLVYSPNLG